MLTFLFLVEVTLFVWIQYKREGNILNLISVLMAPYAVIVFANNCFMYRLGFNRISDNSLMLYMTAFACFFVGSVLTSPGPLLWVDENDNEDRFKLYDINSMIIFLLIIGVISILKLFIEFRSGTFNTSNFSDAQGLMGNGIIGHLLLLSYSILPIVFLYWTYNRKKISAFFAVLLIVIATFSTFVKYNIIGLAVSLFLFILIYKKSALKKAVIILLTFTVIAFVGNYALGFFINKVTASTSFYLNHLWVYTGGSLIHSNDVFTIGMNTHIDLIDKVLVCIMALPRMFIQKFTGVNIFPYHVMEERSIGNTYDKTTNVLDAISYFYPSKGSIIEIILFFAFLVLIGFTFSLIYNVNKKANVFNTAGANFLTYFVFFSFFGTFYVYPGPWEIMVYSLVIPNLFIRSKKVRIIFGHNKYRLTLRR